MLSSLAHEHVLHIGPKVERGRSQATDKGYCYTGWLGGIVSKALSLSRAYLGHVVVLAQFAQVRVQFFHSLLVRL